MRNDAFDKLTAFLGQLEQRGIGYTLAHHRDEAIMVSVAVPGERWEIEFLGDGSVEVERFTSQGEIYGEEALSELFTRYAEPEHDDLTSSQVIEAIAAGEETDYERAL
jgi:hypothetical protein